MNETMNMQKCEKLWLQIIFGKNLFPPGLDGLQPKSPATPGGNKLSIQHLKFLKVLFSGINQFPPGLDELQPKSSANPGGNKQSI